MNIINNFIKALADFNDTCHAGGPADEYFSESPLDKEQPKEVNNSSFLGNLWHGFKEEMLALHRELDRANGYGADDTSATQNRKTVP